MKEALQYVVIYGAALFITARIFQGLLVPDNFIPFFTASVLFTIGLIILGPVVSVITFPVRFLTFGLIPVLTIALNLFALSLVYPAIRVTEFTFSGLQVDGLNISSFHASTLLSYALISVTIYAFKRIFEWVFSIY